MRSSDMLNAVYVYYDSLEAKRGEKKDFKRQGKPHYALHVYHLTLKKGVHLNERRVGRQNLKS